MKFSATERRALYIGAGLTVLVLVARLMGIGEGLSLRSLDFLFYLRGPVEPKTPIVIVAIDNESFNEMPERWTWPRGFYAKEIDRIMKGKPKAIVFDMLFTEESASAPQQDTELAAACRRSGCVILGAELVHVRDKQFEYEEMKLPIKELQKAIYSTGVVNTPQDPDAFVRRGGLVWKVHDERHFSLAMEALRKYLTVGKGEINLDNAQIEFGERKIPVDEKGQMLINYSGPSKTFKTVPFYQVFKGMIDPAIFKDAIVFIGATAVDLHDVFHMPFTWDPIDALQEATQMPGVEIHANVIETIVQQRFIRQLPDLVAPLLVLGLGLLVSFIAIRARIWISLVVAVSTGFGLMAISIWLFTSQMTFMEFVHPLFAVGFAFLGCTTYRASVEMREKQRVRATFARYVSPHVLTTVLTNPPELGGSRRVATILFSDVRGFTSMSEKLTAHEVVEILNEYLTEMVDEVLKHDGTLDKFVGDAVMAVYGSPMDQPDHALRAVSTAWEMHLRHEALKKKWVEEGKVPFEIGIGLNTGEVVAGNMGSPNRMEFTVIGDNVNLAARMESATKDAGAKILMSESTYLLVKDHVQIKELPPVHMKGKSEDIKVFALLGVDEAAKALVRTKTGQLSTKVTARR